MTNDAQETDAAANSAPGESTARIVYILYLVGIVIGLTGIVGVVMAYLHRHDAPPWLATHFRFQIRTFWIGLLYLFLATILTIIAIGYFVFLFWMLWLVIRCVKGMKALDLKQAVENPSGWMF